MTRYRLIGETIEAMKLDGTILQAERVRSWIKLEGGDTRNAESSVEFEILTEDGPMHVSADSYVIKDSTGFYSCSPDMFVQLYERV